ncbi:glycosyltransferase family 31 protein [Lentithecium fluviatile CBS 122367]|uniref:Glycosyltransferase family 31 protein n=1 Tax=Lentithecium fluviatile CBS 122367 TaxID=1168545 RepID=A0A6G1ITI8_9PLEO|nr:glycosyltransferase family 31 protein [Lentithecium fluviatile CBS 122367]
MVRFTPLRLLCAAVILCVLYLHSSLRDMVPPAKIRFGEEYSPFKSGVMEDVTIDWLISSDRKVTFQGFDVVDALPHVRPEYKWENTDFNVYNSIQAANETADKTSYLRPDAQCLYRFLTHFNPKSTHYFGSPIWPKKKAPFAHGGSGFMLSRGALDKLMARGSMFAENHHFPAPHFFGEKVLKKSWVPVFGYWPMFNGDKPPTLRFRPEQWCESIMTMHYLQEEDFTGLSQWEQARKHPGRALMFEELFTLIEPRLQAKADDWTNMSDDVIHTKGMPIKSFDNCERACLKDSKCLQYEHTGSGCRISHSIRLGDQRLPHEVEKYLSGWMLGRIKDFKKANSPCQGAHFVHSNP